MSHEHTISNGIKVYACLYELWNKEKTYFTGAVFGASFELLNASCFAFSIVFTGIDAACQRHAILIQTFVPVGIFFKVLKNKCLTPMGPLKMDPFS